MEIIWSSNTYIHGSYLFKRKGKPGAYRYELWKDGKLLDNTIRDEFQIMRICRDGYLKG